MTHAVCAAVSGHQIVAYQLFVLAATMSACLACLLHQNRAVKSFGLNTHSTRILRARRIPGLSILSALYRIWMHTEIIVRGGTSGVC